MLENKVVVSVRTISLIRAIMAAILFLAGQVLSENRDFYKILGIKRNANNAEIKRAYRKLSMQYHPDKNPGDTKAREKFAEVSAAYTVLQDSNKRRTYDRCGEKCLDEEEQRKDQQHNSPFGSFFGHHHQEEQKGPNITLKIRVTLKELYEGKNFELQYNRKIICPHCRGQGGDDPDDVKKCPRCKGQGHITVKQQIMPGYYQQFQQQCNSCEGKGKVVTSVCHVCHNKKLVDSVDSLRVYVEKGTPDGHIIDFQDAADEYINVRSGSVKLKVEMLPDPVFERDGDNLKMNVHISLREALLGFEREITHFDGHLVEIFRNNKITRPGEQQIIKNQGMPMADFSGNYGNLIITYIVDFPKKFTDGQKVLVKQFFLY